MVSLFSPFQRVVLNTVLHFRPCLLFLLPLIKGFGELTPHLDEFKSPYRLEILEPRGVSEKEKRAYFAAAYQCFRVYAAVYLESLAAARPESDPEKIEQNRAGIREFVDILYKEDIAVKMGKMIFPPRDFDRYFLTGFWGVE
jgi:hypothetical protein